MLALESPEVIMISVINDSHWYILIVFFLCNMFQEELLSSRMKREEKKKRKAKAEFIEDNITEIADALGNVCLLWLRKILVY